MPVDRLGFWSPPTTVHPPELHAPFPPEYSWIDPVPPPTKQTPGELLNDFYIARRNQPDWTDPNGPLKSQLEVFNDHPEYVAAPIGSSGLVGEFPRPGGLAAVPVPVCFPGSVLDGPQVEVAFRHWEPEGPSLGVLMTELYIRDGSQLEDAEDFVLGKFKGRELKLIIAWPGYEVQKFTIRPVAKDGGPLTRFDLACQVTTAYAVFFRKVETERLLPKKVGFYNIALHQGRKSRWDSLGVQLTQLYLVSFRGTIGGYWVADVDIV